MEESTTKESSTCQYISFNDNNKRVKCRNKAITGNGLCKLHRNNADSTSVPNNPEKGVRGFASYSDIGEEATRKEKPTVQQIEKTVRNQISFRMSLETIRCVVSSRVVT